MTDFTITAADVERAIEKAAIALKANADYLTQLDQAMGDGDLGITAKKIANGLDAYTDENEPGDDIGKYLMTAGMKTNSVAPSTMGTLLATALMRAGKEARGESELGPATLVKMLKAANVGIQERGKAKPGDKTLIDVLHPAVEAFADAIDRGMSFDVASNEMLTAAQRGLEEVIPLQSKIGRASWVGERTQGKVDPGCALVVTVLEGVMGEERDN